MDEKETDCAVDQVSVKETGPIQVIDDHDKCSDQASAGGEPILEARTLISYVSGDGDKNHDENVTSVGEELKSSGGAAKSGDFPGMEQKILSEKPVQKRDHTDLMKCLLRYDYCPPVKVLPESLFMFAVPVNSNRGGRRVLGGSSKNGQENHEQRQQNNQQQQQPSSMTLPSSSLSSSRDGGSVGAGGRQPLCAISSRVAKYIDPKTGLAYRDSTAYRSLTRTVAGDFEWADGLGCFVGAPGGPVAKGVPQQFLEAMKECAKAGW